jgi:hypothetical protein
MLGPSPDWFSGKLALTLFDSKLAFVTQYVNVGTSNLNLCLSNCTWIDEYMEDLYPTDAGTDSGLSYNVSEINLAYYPSIE